MHIAKNQLARDQSLPAAITATIIELAAQFERDFLSARTKEPYWSISKGQRAVSPRTHPTHARRDRRSRLDLIFTLGRGAA